MSVDLRRARPGRANAYYAAALVVPLLLFAFLATAVATDTTSILRLDGHVAQWAYDLSSQHPRVVDVLDAIAWLFSTVPVTVLVLALAGFSLWRREVRVALWMVLSGVVVLLTPFRASP